MIAVKSKVFTSMKIVRDSVAKWYIILWKYNLCRETAYASVAYKGREHPLKPTGDKKTEFPFIGSFETWKKRQSLIKCD